MSLPILYKRTSTGKIQTWKIDVETSTEDFTATLVTTYGQLDGKLQVARDVITEGKNVGKANETSVFEQARAEAASQYEKKLKRGYVLSPDAAAEGKVDTNAITGGVSPMLAHSFDKQGHKISFPAYVQPKLDGHRCIAIVQDGKATLWSRTRKRITGVPHIERQLEHYFPNETIILDGELYNHDYKDRFEELTSFIRQVTPKPGHTVVQYWIYDVIGDLPFSNRQNALMGLRELFSDNKMGSLVVLDTPEVQDEQEMMDLFQVYTDFGFEGLMLRNKNGLYKNSRSYDLQKVKEFEDAEFEIADVEEGRGKMAKKAIFVCKTETGELFNAKMIGPLAELEEYYVNKDKYIGKWLTVKYQGITNGNVPRFPVAMRLREDV